MAILPFFTLLLILFLDLNLKALAASPANPKASSPQKKTTMVLNEAQWLYAKQQYQGVIDVLQPQIEKLTRAEYLMLARSQIKVDLPVAAIKTLQIMIGNFPKDILARTELARLYLAQRKEREALQTLKEVLELDPKFEEAYLLTAQIYESRKNKYELRMVYLDLISKIGAKPEYISKVCEISYLEGIYDSAKEYCQRGMKTSPQTPENFIFYALTLNQTGKADEADKIMKKNADSFKDSEKAQLSYAQFLDERKKFAQSVIYYERAINVPKATGAAWLGRATANFEIQKFDVSLNSFKEACKVNRQTNLVIRKFVNILRQQKQVDWAPQFEALAENCIGQFIQK